MYSHLPSETRSNLTIRQDRLQWETGIAELPVETPLQALMWEPGVAEQIVRLEMDGCRRDQSMREGRRQRRRVESDRSAEPQCDTQWAFV